MITYFSSSRIRRDGAWAIVAAFLASLTVSFLYFFALADTEPIGRHGSGPSGFVVLFILISAVIGPILAYRAIRYPRNWLTFIKAHATIFGATLSVIVISDDRSFGSFFNSEFSAPLHFIIFLFILELILTVIADLLARASSDLDVEPIWLFPGFLIALIGGYACGILAWS